MGSRAQYIIVVARVYLFVVIPGYGREKIRTFRFVESTFDMYVMLLLGLVDMVMMVVEFLMMSVRSVITTN